MLIGGSIGSLFGGPLGAILGAVLGHKVEGAAFGHKPRRGVSYSSMSSRNRANLFCASAAAMLAKMAKADGHVSRTEIASVENAFRRLGFTPAARRYAIDVFRKAKDDRHTIYEYAQEFAAAVDSVEVRELFYELLWDIAQSDGDVTEAEHDILNRITEPLGIGARWYEFMARGRHSRARTSSGGRRESSGWGSSRSSDPLAEAYATLGVASTASYAPGNKLASAPFALGGFKPCVESFRKIADMLGVEPHSVVVVGDRADTDGLGASASGMHYLKVTGE